MKLHQLRTLPFTKVSLKSSGPSISEKNRFEFLKRIISEYLKRIISEYLKRIIS